MKSENFKVGTPRRGGSNEPENKSRDADRSESGPHLSERSDGGRRLVWIVVVVFALQIAVWAAWITFASKHRVAEVPLVETR